MSRRPEPLTYDALLADALGQVPGLCPAWTDHNPSDPGIAVLELLAHLAEMQLYQARQVPDEHLRALLQLIRGAASPLPDDQPIEAAIDETLHALREPYRVVTPADHALLIATQWPRTPGAVALGGAADIRRSHCLIDRDLERPGAEQSPAPGHLSVIVVPAAPPATRRPAPGPAVLAALAAFLEPRRLLTVHTHVVAPTYLTIGVAARVYLQGSADARATRSRAQAVLSDMFDPLRGGPTGVGWPFGRNAYTSEVLAQLDAVPGVDFVEGVELLTADPTRRIVDGAELVGLRLRPHELVDYDPDAGTLELWEQTGGTWQTIGS